MFKLTRVSCSQVYSQMWFNITYKRNLKIRPNRELAFLANSLVAPSTLLLFIGVIPTNGFAELIAYTWTMSRTLRGDSYFLLFYFRFGSPRAINQFCISLRNIEYGWILTGPMSHENNDDPLRITRCMRRCVFSFFTIFTDKISRNNVLSVSVDISLVHPWVVLGRCYSSWCRWWFNSLSLNYSVFV